MKSNYIITSILLAFSTSLLLFNGVKYLLSSRAGNDLLVILSVTIMLCGYSFFPKPQWLNRYNWLAVPLLSFSFVFVVSYYDPRVGQGFARAILFSLFTFDVPFLIYLAVVVANLIACNGMSTSSSGKANQETA